MANSLRNDIRAALEKQLATVSGLPSIQYDGVPLEPTPDTPFGVATLIGTAERPATVGANPQYLRQGLFNVTLYYPVGKGAGDLEYMADQIRSAFPVDASLSFGAALVRVLYAETASQARIEAGMWLTLTVTISWYSFTP